MEGASLKSLKPFYEARFKDENGNIFARKTDDPEDIRFDSPDQVDLSQLHDSAVVEDSRGKKHTAPGKLLDLAGLSAILAKQGLKPANVLKTYQEMYENQIVRGNSRMLRKSPLTASL